MTRPIAGYAGARAWIRTLLCGVLLAFAPQLASAQALSPIEPGAFEIFVAKVTVLCKKGASRDCADLAWDFVDRERDDALSVPELTRFQRGLQDWSLAQGDALPRRTRNGIAIGMLISQAVGIDRLVASYDQNADGKLTRDEAFSDIVLDERPLETVIKDPEAFDRPSFVRRLGFAGPLLDTIE